MLATSPTEARNQRRDGGSDERRNLRLVHAECHRRHHAGDHERAKNA
ncbi:HNH endonuclease [Streptomyces sp. NPDC000070]